VCYNNFLQTTLVEFNRDGHWVKNHSPHFLCFIYKTIVFNDFEHENKRRINKNVLINTLQNIYDF